MNLGTLRSKPSPSSVPKSHTSTDSVALSLIDEPVGHHTVL